MLVGGGGAALIGLTGRNMAWFATITTTIIIIVSITTTIIIIVRITTTSIIRIKTRRSAPKRNTLKIIW